MRFARSTEIHRNCQVQHPTRGRRQIALDYKEI
jgi:hypothetical protein